MSTMETVQAVVEQPRILANGEVFAIRIGAGFLCDFDDEDGYPRVFRTTHVFSREKAEELFRKLEGYPDAQIVPIQEKEPNEITFWVDEFADGRFTSCHVKIASAIRRDNGENMPDWFKAAMMAADPGNPEWDDFERKDYNIAWDIFTDEKYGRVRRWMDHYGWSGEGEDSYFVSEPYGLDMEGMQDLIQVCQKFNFDVQISGHSTHYPSATLRITIRPNVKLPYTKRVRIVTAEQSEFEQKRDAAALRLNLILACDYIDHVMHLAGDERKDLVGGVDILRSIAADGLEMEEGVALPSAERYLDDAKFRLDFAVDFADRRGRELGRVGMGASPEIQLWAAIAQAARTGRNVWGWLSLVGFHCAEAVENDFCRKNENWTSESFYQARETETKWQHEHIKPAVEAFWEKWNQEAE